MQEQTLSVSRGEGVLANDVGVALGQAFLEETPVHGSVTVNVDGSFAYIPPPGFVGSDSWTYVVAVPPDIAAGPQTVTVEVEPAAGAPVAAPDSYTAVEDTELNVATPGVLGNDTDEQGAALTARMDTPAEHGNVTVRSDGSFTYRPASDFFGTDSFTYQASDGALTSAAATVTLEVSGAPDAPVASNDSYSVDEDTTLNVSVTGGLLANDSDKDGDNLQVVLVSGVAHGTLTLENDGSFAYTSVENFNGDDSFSYRATDGVLESNVATATLTVDPINDPPVVLTAAYEVVKNSVLELRLTGEDVEGTELVFELVGSPASGAAELASPSGGVRYTPNADFVGSDSFTFRASDGELASLPATVTIQVVASAPPRVTRIFPTNGPVDGLVQVFGEVFGGDTGSATIGGVGATVERWRPLAVTLRVPGGLAPGAHDLVLTNAGGSSGPISYHVRPWISSLVPRIVAPSATLTIHGTSFGTEEGTVSVRTLFATVTSWSNDVIVATIPAATTGECKIRVQTASGERSALATAVIEGSDQWRHPVTPDHRSSAQTVSTGNLVLHFGGTISADDVAQEYGMIYDLWTDRWSRMGQTGAPSSSPVRVFWTGTEAALLMDVAGNTPLYLYDPITDSWRTSSTASGLGERSGPAITFTGTQIVVWGGWHFGEFGDGAVYDIATDTWSTMAGDTAPSPRWKHASAWTGEHVLVWGGEANSQSLDDGGLYSPSEDRWYSLNAENGPPTANPILVPAGKALAAVGGAVHLYSVVLDAWTPLTSSLPRDTSGFFWTGDGIITYAIDQSGAGWTGGFLELASDTKTTFDYPGGISVRGRGISLAWTGLELYAYGGGRLRPSGQQPYFYQLASDSWRPSVPAPTSFPDGEEPYFVAAGASALLFGPRVASFSAYYQRASTGWRYEPTSGTWMPLSTSGAPRIASLAAVGYDESTNTLVIWSGTWGRISNESLQSEGGIYDIDADTWTAIATTGAPVPRFAAASAWTGNSLLVWGGEGADDVFLGDGATYTPSTETWTAINPSGAPSARARAASAWLGDRLFVWGGDDTLGALDDGAIYDLSGDGWTPISTTDRPSVRNDALAIWTGQEVIVWGGTSTAGPLADGARYDPSSDTWIAMATTSAPTGITARNAKAAVDSSEVLVALRVFDANGDETGDVQVWKYDLNGDSWSRGSRVNQFTCVDPVDAAVWTGSELLVYSRFNTVIGRYAP